MAFEVFNFGKQLGIVGGEADVQTTVAGSSAEGFEALNFGKQLGIIGRGASSHQLPPIQGRLQVVRDPCDPSERSVFLGFRQGPDPESLDNPLNLNTVTYALFGCEPTYGGNRGAGARGYEVGFAPGGGGGGVRTPPKKKKYPLPLEEFKRQTDSPPSQEEVEKLVNSCPGGASQGCCDDYAKVSFFKAYKRLFDKDSSILNKYPPYAYNCLVEAFKVLEKIKCHVQKDSSVVDFILSVDGKELSFGDLMTEEDMYTALYNALTSILSREMADSRCAVLGQGFIFPQLGFEGSRTGSHENQWMQDWCKDNRGKYSSKNPIVNSAPNHMLVIDVANGRVYSNPFWPDPAPSNWKPTPENLLYEDPFLDCLT